MGSISAVDVKTGRKFYLDYPDDLQPGDKVVFLLSLQGAVRSAHGSAPTSGLSIQREVSAGNSHPICGHQGTVSALGGSGDDAHLRNIVDYVFDKYGKDNIASFWLVGHSQGGMTANRILGDDFFKDRVDGWLSLSGGRIGPIELPASFFVPVMGAPMPPMPPREATHPAQDAQRRPTATSPLSSRPASMRWSRCHRLRHGPTNTGPARG